MYSEADHHWMREAIELAKLGRFSTMPNPRVGCVIVKQGQVVGQGWHRRAGEPHSEALALAQAGDAARGATAYVTLEPCSHHGRTPPCADGLIEAGVARVVAAMEDPNPLVSGRGLQRLRDAGIEVRCGLLSNESEALNPGFVKRMRTGRPWMRMKIAATLDGFIALPNGESQWITGQAARADGHAWRMQACAVLTGVGTIKSDNPRLTVRELPEKIGQDSRLSFLFPLTRQPTRVVVDSRLETPTDANVLDVSLAPTVIAHLASKQGVEQALREQGVELFNLAKAAPDKADKLDLATLVHALGKRGFNEVHVEAGAKLNVSLLEAGLIDELLLYQAPILFGQGLPMAPMQAPARLTDLGGPHTWQIKDQQLIGSDQRLILQKA